jgi:hypothetical protein
MDWHFITVITITGLGFLAITVLPLWIVVREIRDSRPKAKE